MRLLAARGTPSRRLEPGRGGQAAQGVQESSHGAGGSCPRRSQVGGGDRGLHSPGLPPGLSPHLRRLLLPGPELPFCLGFEAEPQKGALAQAVLVWGSPSCLRPLIQAPLLFTVQIQLGFGFVIF